MLQDFQNERFDKLFNLVLASLPNVHQKKVRNAVRLVTDREDLATQNGVFDAKAAVGWRGGGNVLFLNAKELQRETEARIAGVIAHELAHVVLGHTSAKSATHENAWQCDLHCDELAATWGFERTVQAMANENSNRIRINNQWS